MEANMSDHQIFALFLSFVMISDYSIMGLDRSGMRRALLK